MGEDYFCEFGNAPNSGAHLKDYTQNVLVLCSACSELFEVEGARLPRPDICPPVAMCTCRQMVQQVRDSAVFQRCLPRDAYFDPRHRWIAGAGLACLVRKPSEARWITDTSMRTQLRNRLSDYAR